jgi:hypothetical protein
MKKSILILLFFITLGAKAQGNLQFNRVINYTMASQTVFSPGLLQTTVTVPAGKVWKIEAASYNGAGSPGWSLILDNYLLFTYIINSGGGLNYFPEIHFPIWLPAGTYNLKAQYYITTPSALFVGASISIIEFNII